jgi:hypothetical protein
MSISAAEKLPPPAIAEAPASLDRVLRATSGASVALTTGLEGERLELRDARDRVLVRFDPATGCAEVWAPTGDLALRTRGKLELDGAAGVSIRSAEHVRVEANDGRHASTLRVEPGKAELRAGALILAAETASLVFGDVRSRLARLRSTIGDATLSATRLESTAERVFERAKSVFRTVEDVHQLVAGRSRTLVDGGFELRARHASIDAQDDVKIDGKRIHLG